MNEGFTPLPDVVMCCKGQDMREHHKTNKLDDEVCDI